MGFANASKGSGKIGEQKDIAIHVAEKIMAGNFLSTAKNIIDALGAKRIRFDVRFVAQTKLVADFPGAFVGTKNDDFYRGIKAFPTEQRVTLGHADVTTKGFGSCEECQHERLTR